MKVILLKQLTKHLSEQAKFRLSEIIGIENYFHQKINQRNHTVKN